MNVKGINIMNRLSGKTAFITGASSGFGYACAIRLADLGVNLILSGRRAQRLDELKNRLISENIKIETHVFDVRSRNEVTTKVENILLNNDIDILVNSAGLALDSSKFDECDFNDWEEMIDANIKGLLYVSKPVIAHMRKRNAGHIINLGSIAGEITYPNGNVYCATKAAVKSISEAMNIDLAGTDIRVSNIEPGAALTEFSSVRFKGNKDKVNAIYEGFTPLYAEDIADLIVYILNAPPHVNIQQTVIMPTAQRNPFVLSRKK